MPRANYDLPEELLEKVIVQRRHVIAVQNEKGGVAKTPYTFHMATALAEAGCKVLCIDLDPQGDLTTTLALYALEYRGDFTAQELALANTFTVFDDDASSIPLKINDNLELMVGSHSLVGLQGMGQDRMVMLQEFGRGPHPSGGVDYDFVFIDCPPVAGNYTTAAAMAATDILIPTRPEEYSDKAVRKHVKTIERLKPYNPVINVLGVLITDVRKNVNIESDFVDKIRGHGFEEADEKVRAEAEKIGRLVFNAQVHKKASFNAATTMGVPLFRYEKSELVDELYAVLVEMLERMAEGEG
jgi:chromosome partitioning protein